MFKSHKPQLVVSLRGSKFNIHVCPHNTDPDMLVIKSTDKEALTHFVERIGPAVLPEIKKGHMYYVAPLSRVAVEHGIGAAMMSVFDFALVNPPETPSYGHSDPDEHHDDLEASDSDDDEDEEGDEEVDDEG